MPPPIPAPPQPHQRTARARPRRQRRHKRRFPRWMLLAGLMIFGLSTCAAVAVAGAIVVSAGRVPPGASALGVNVGMMTETDAAAHLENAAAVLTLRDGNRAWTVSASELGIRLDAAATAARAANIGLGGIFGAGEVMPVAAVDAATLVVALEGLRAQVELPPRNASIRLVNETVEPVPAAVGRSLDVNATANQIAANPSLVLVDGVLNLVMRDVAPQVTDAGPLVAEARTLLASPLRIEAYDPFTDTSLVWEALPSQWGGWLLAENSPSSALGVRLALDEAQVAAFLAARAAATLPPHQFIELDEAAAEVSAAIVTLSTRPRVRVYERDRSHVVRAGETITSIAYDYGIPYPYIQNVNGGAAGVSVGQSITIPSREVFLEREPIPDKRIVVSISGNYTRVYEGGALKWDWVSSVGINTSPTWPGVYQILEHELNAYAGNWDLYMPWFLGVYKPIPGSDFTNGFHGFPTRGGGQILWENSLGTRVTYGCILLSNTNVQLLYDWAEDGVIVEIKP